MLNRLLAEAWSRSGSCPASAPVAQAHLRAAWGAPSPPLLLQPPGLPRLALRLLSPVRCAAPSPLCCTGHAIGHAAVLALPGVMQRAGMLLAGTPASRCSGLKASRVHLPASPVLLAANP